MKLSVNTWLLIGGLTLLLAQPAFSKTLEEAARQASRQNNNAKVLSARTVQQQQRRVHQVKVLTKDGVVKTVRIPDNSQKKKQPQKAKPKR